MGIRKRKHIPLKQKYAAALALQLPQEILNEARRLKLPAEAIISFFQVDHNVLHSLGGSDEWWNLTPMMKHEHREKSRGDTSIAAKVKRISSDHSEHTERMRRKLLAAPDQIETKKKPTQKIKSRGFDKASKRKIESRGFRKSETKTNRSVQPMARR